MSLLACPRCGRFDEDYIGPEPRLLLCRQCEEAYRAAQRCGAVLWAMAVLAGAAWRTDENGVETWWPRTDWPDEKNGAYWHMVIRWWWPTAGKHDLGLLIDGRIADIEQGDPT